MRGVWLRVVCLLCAGLASGGCVGGPTQRDLRKPYQEELKAPPPDDPKFSQPPTYPEEKNRGPQNDSGPRGRSGPGGGPGGPGMGPMMMPGAGGAGMGGPGMSGAGLGGRNY